MPVFLLIVLGFFLRKLGFLNDVFCKYSDKLVFHLALPVMLVLDIGSKDIYSEFDGKYLLFCALVTTFVFASIWIGARVLLKDKNLVGEFVQVSYRSSAAILGCAIIQNIYGDTGMAPLMILGSVPLFNIFAVLVLSLEGAEHHEIPLRERLTSALIGVVKNPIIIGIALGLVIALLRWEFPAVLETTMSSVAAIATPLALISIGGAWEGKKALSQLKLTGIASFIKLLLLPALFLPLAVYFGFTGSKLIALIVMLGSTSTPTCYIMAKNLGHEGVLSASVIVMTTLFSGFTLTFWIFLAQHFGYLL